MTVLNLFLNGVFYSEVMCAEVHLPEEYRGGYIVSLVPFGIFRMEDKKKSLLWHLVNNPPTENVVQDENDNPSSEKAEEDSPKAAGTQLSVF